MSKRNLLNLTAILLLLLFSTTAFAEKQLGTIEDAGISLKLSRLSSSTYQLQIKPTKPDENLTANVFIVDNPTRIVIDIPQHLSKTATSVSVSDANLTSIRLGIHANRTRIVLDIAGSKAPVYEVKLDDKMGVIVVEIAFDKQLDTSPIALQENNSNSTEKLTNIEQELLQETGPDLNQYAKSEKATIAGETSSELNAQPILKQENGSSFEPELDPINSVKENPAGELPADEALPTPTAEPTINKVEDSILQTPPPLTNSTPDTSALPPTETQPTASPTVPQETAPSTDTTLGTVKGIFYQAAKNSETGSVMIDVDGLNTYALNPKEVGRYELLLKDCKLAGSYLTLPQFPPDTFSGFQVILATTIGRDILINIYVEEKIKISPFIAQGRLWLKAAKSL